MQLLSACVLSIGSDSVEMHVLRDEPVWRWEIRFVHGQRLDKGEAATRIAAKAAAEAALELRLTRAGFYKRNAGCRWRDLDAQSKVQSS